MESVIIIHTKDAGDSRPFEKGFHQQETKRLVEMIEKSIQDVRSGEGQGETIHSHQTIGVFGERGAGKTSFILSAIQKINKEKDNVAIIGPIDPTLLEHGEQLLPHLIVAILESYESLKKHIQDEPGSELARAYLRCVRQLRVLSDQWSETLGKELMGDAETYGFELLEEMYSAHNLRAAFRDFCRETLNKTSKKLLVIVIDDVDVAFEQGWPVLETVRKYLDFPEVVPIILGDFSLYRMLVMQRHHEKLKELYSVETERPRVDRGVAHLTNQYLLKVLPAHRRLELVGKAPFDPDAPIYKIDSQEGQDFRDIFSNFLQKIASIDQRGGSTKREGKRHFDYLPPANVRRLTMLARMIKEILDGPVSSCEDRRHALVRIAGVYEDILAQYDLTVTDILRVSKNPIKEFLWILPKFRGLSQFWRLEAKDSENEGFVKLILRLAVNVAFQCEKDRKRQAGMALGMLILMGWFGQAYEEYLSLSGMDEKSFLRYMGIHSKKPFVLLNDLVLKMIAIEAGASGTDAPPNRTRMFIYFSSDSREKLIKAAQEKGNIGLFYGAISNTGHRYYHIYSPLLGMARLSDYLLEDVKSSSFSVRQLTPKTITSKTMKDDEEGVTDKEDDSIAMDLGILSHTKYTYSEYESIVNSGFFLLNRFTSWVSNRRVTIETLQDLDKQEFLKAFLSRFGPEAKSVGMLTLEEIANEIKNHFFRQKNEQ